MWITAPVALMPSRSTRMFSHILSLTYESSFMYGLSSFLGLIGTLRTMRSKAFSTR